MIVRATPWEHRKTELYFIFKGWGFVYSSLAMSILNITKINPIQYIKITIDKFLVTDSPKLAIRYKLVKAEKNKAIMKGTNQNLLPFLGFTNNVA